MDFFATFLMVPSIPAIAGLIGGIVSFGVFGKNKNKIFMISGILAFAVTAVCIFYIAGFMLVYTLGGSLFGESSISPEYRLDYPSEKGEEGEVNKKDDGVIKEEIGSEYDYIGWWRLDEYEGEAGFSYIEVFKEDWGAIFVRFCDENGGVIDSGLINYSEQRALNGKDLMVFRFDNIGEYGAQPYGIQDGGVYMQIKDYKGFSGTVVYQSEPPINSDYEKWTD